MTKISQDIEAKIRSSFAAQSMMETFGAELKEVASGNVTVTAPVLEGLRQQQDFAHGGLIFSIGDSAAGYAALSVMPVEAEVLTVEMKINLMSPAPASSMLIAEGRVLKPGRRLVVVASDVWSQSHDGERVQVAALQGTMIPVNS
ncbi:MAG: PaaI family thioesterase [Rhizobiaceae bacterium]